MPLRGAVVRALHPNAVPWAVVPALRAALAVAAVAVAGALAGGLVEVGLMYFGASCAAVFVTAGVYQVRLLTALGQFLGAATGLSLGCLAPHTFVSEVALAVLVGLVAGAVGTVGPVLTVGAVMAAIGLAYGQFAGVDLPWWQQAGWLLLGTAVVAGVAVAPWLVRRDHYQRAAVAAIVDAAASVLDADRADAEGARHARGDLAGASAQARAALRDHRLRSGLSRRPGLRRRQQGLAAAERLALAVASAHAGRDVVPRATADAVHVAAGALRAGREVPDDDGLAGPAPLLDALHDLAHPDGVTPDWPSASLRWRSGVRAATSRPAVTAGLRLALCLGIATAVTAAWHDQTHSYWLPLTVATVVRPEYASVFVRSVNRAAGTLAGAVVAATVLVVLPSGLPTAVLAAAAIGLAVAASPRSYALSVLGITCSALLSASIGTRDPVFPAVRLLDTLAGTAIALVFGYLLWPGRRGVPETVRIAEATRAAGLYLDQALLPAARRADWALVRDRAYRLAHTSRAAAYSSLADPPPTSTRAAAVLPVALALESLVDEITRVETVGARDGGAEKGAEIAVLRGRLAEIDAAFAAATA
jgi:uncharacterized membrane protein YccC